MTTSFDTHISCTFVEPFLQVLENCQNIFKQVRESAELAAEEQLEETTDRQLEEIDEQMRAWSRVGAL